jgi:hypothetical protein
VGNISNTYVAVYWWITGSASFDGALSSQPLPELAATFTSEGSSGLKIDFLALAINLT